MAANTSMLSKHSSGQRPAESIPTNMTALVKAGPVPGAELRTVPVPVIGPLDVLMKVSATSICGTDVHIYEWDLWAQGRVHPPLVFGHECAGVVVAMETPLTPGCWTSTQGRNACRL
jgi:D-arabinose 1-dehydrogenase-like Zn-dependent alcohol dehydrogenase